MGAVTRLPAPQRPAPRVRRQPRRRTVGLVLGCLLNLIALHAPAVAEPWRPADEGEILEVLPRPAAGIRNALRRLQAQVAADPDDPLAALDLARRYLDLGRSEADPRYDGYAEALLQPWWARNDVPSEALVLRAVIRQRSHRFDAALADLDLALANDPANAQARLTRATILQVTGAAAAALAECQRLLRSAPFAASVCIARSRSLTGAAADAYRRLAHTLERAKEAEPAERQWAFTVLGEIAHRRGDLEAATGHLRQALTNDGRSVYALAALSDVLLDAGRCEEVRTLLAGETGVDGLLLRLTLAEARLVAADTEAHAALLRERFAAAQQRGDGRHLREEARFALEVEKAPPRALALALANWATQKEPADAWLVLGSALAAGDAAAARPVLTFVAETHLEDTAIAGLIRQLEGEKG